MTDSPGRPGGRFDWQAAGMLVVTVLAIAVASVQRQARREALTREQQVVRSARDVQIDLTLAHLSVEEWVHGVNDARPERDAYPRYEHALQLLEWLDAEAISPRMMAAPGDSLMRNRIGALRDSVSALRRMAAAQIAGGRPAGGPADAANPRFDRAYHGAVSETQAVGEGLGAMLAEDRARVERQEVVFDALLAVGLLVLVFRFVVERRRGRRAGAPFANTGAATSPDVQEREARARAVLNSSIDAIVTADATGTITACNPAAARLFGVTEADLVGHGVRQFMAEPYRSLPPEVLGQYFVRARENPEGVTEIVRGVRSDGTILTIDMSLSAIRTGGAPGFMAVMRDIGDRVAAEQRFSVIFEHATASHFLLREAQVVDCNAAASTLFAASSKTALVGHDVFSFVPEHQPDGRPSREVLQEVLGFSVGSGTRRVEVEFRRFTGEHFPAEVSLTPVELDGQAITLLEVRDLTERRQSERALVVAKETAEAAARSKSQFLATVSHEIRTPMNGVLGMTSLLLETDLDDKQLQYTTAVKLSADSLLAIINDILDFSKIEAGKLTIEPLPFDLVGTLEDACGLMAPRADEKGIALAMHVKHGIPTRFVGDAGRIRQIALNLLANAVKFTSFGHVVLALDVMDRRGPDAVVRLSVQDTGIGIPEGQQAGIFDEFAQGDASMSRRFGGTGLGLAITRRLAEMMGGTAGFRSVEGRGSMFWVTLRLSVPADAHETSPMPDLANRRALVVDAQEVTRRALALRLESFGTAVDTRALGDHAIQLMRQEAAQQRPFDVVFVEQGTRTSDGLDFSAAVAADRHCAATPLVLLARAVDAPTADDAHGMGFVDVITKPARGSALLAAMRRARAARVVASDGSAVAPAHAADAAPSLPAAVHGRPSPPGGLKHAHAEPGGPSVLLVEDNPVNQLVARAYLERAGCRVAIAENGAEALTLTATSRFDVIFMDCQMPVLDGYAATAAIRRREGDAQRTPIIAMTANAMPGDRERCLAAGMDDYIPKPVVDERLHEVLVRWTTQGRHR